MSQHFEIVIFTAAVQDYADWVLDQLDTEGYISYRLYRQHALPTGGNFFIKDLSRLGRDISRTLIVDNVAENFQLQPDNGVFIRTWIDDPTDNALEELAPLLKEVAVRNVRDVREALRVFRIQMMEQVQKGILKPQLSLAEGLVEVENNPEDVYDSPIKQK
jgi:CTD small phosphatase-like protein 2